MSRAQMSRRGCRNQGRRLHEQVYRINIEGHIFGG